MDRSGRTTHTASTTTSKGPMPIVSIPTATGSQAMLGQNGPSMSNTSTPTHSNAHRGVASAATMLKSNGGNALALLSGMPTGMGGTSGASAAHPSPVSTIGPVGALSSITNTNPSSSANMNGNSNGSGTCNSGSGSPLIHPPRGGFGLSSLQPSNSSQTSSHVSIQRRIGSMAGANAPMTNSTSSGTTVVVGKRLTPPTTNSTHGVSSKALASSGSTTNTARNVLPLPVNASHSGNQVVFQGGRSPSARNSSTSAMATSHMVGAENELDAWDKKLMNCMEVHEQSMAASRDRSMSGTVASLSGSTAAGILGGPNTMNTNHHAMGMNSNTSSKDINSSHHLYYYQPSFHAHAHPRLPHLMRNAAAFDDRLSLEKREGISNSPLLHTYDTPQITGEEMYDGTEERTSSADAAFGVDEEDDHSSTFQPSALPTSRHPNCMHPLVNNYPKASVGTTEDLGKGECQEDELLQQIRSVLGTYFSNRTAVSRIDRDSMISNFIDMIRSAAEHGTHASPHSGLKANPGALSPVLDQGGCQFKAVGDSAYTLSPLRGGTAVGPHTIPASTLPFTSVMDNADGRSTIEDEVSLARSVSSTQMNVAELLIPRPQAPTIGGVGSSINMLINTNVASGLPQRSTSRTHGLSSNHLRSATSKASHRTRSNRCNNAVNSNRNIVSATGTHGSLQPTNPGMASSTTKSTNNNTTVRRVRPKVVVATHHPIHVDPIMSPLSHPGLGGNSTNNNSSTGSGSVPKVLSPHRWRIKRHSQSAFSECSRSSTDGNLSTATWSDTTAACLQSNGPHAASTTTTSVTSSLSTQAAMATVSEEAAVSNVSAVAVSKVSHGNEGGVNGQALCGSMGAGN